MRNYFKLRNLRIYPYHDFPPPRHIDTTDFYVVFGGTDEDLYARQQAAIAQDGRDALVGDPQVIWFELDLQFFSNIIAQAAGQIWTQTHLNDVFPTDPNTPLLYDQTRIEVEGSPRKTWSHGE
jgi:hypothetical protein